MLQDSISDVKMKPISRSIISDRCESEIETRRVNNEIYTEMTESM